MPRKKKEVYDPSEEAIRQKVEIEVEFMLLEFQAKEMKDGRLARPTDRSRWQLDRWSDVEQLIEQEVQTRSSFAERIRSAWHIVESS